MIRSLKENDVATLMKIWLSGNQEAHAFIEPSYWEQHIVEVRQQLQEADLFIYETDGEIKGFAGVMEGYLAGIFIVKEYQHAGIGQQLIAEIKKRYPKITLHVYQKNQAAVNFYLKQGFEIVSENVDETTKEMELEMYH